MNDTSHMWKDSKNKPQVIISKTDTYDKLTELQGDFWIIDNVFSSDFCESVITKFEADDRKSKGVISSGEGKDYKVSTDLMISGIKGWEREDEHIFKEIFKQIQQLLLQLLKPFADDIQINIPFGRDDGYNIQRTNVGGYYKWHIEIGGYGPDIDRTLILVIYLNDKGLKGGGTHFQRQGVLVEPREGRLVMFPPHWTHIHCGSTVEEGIKYIIFTSFKPALDEKV